MVGWHNKIGMNKFDNNKMMGHATYNKTKYYSTKLTIINIIISYNNNK